MAEPTADSWCRITPQQGAKLLSALRVPWWVAGGWGLDLFLEGITRAHKDLDIGIFRQDAAMVMAALSGWEFFEAKNGILTQLVRGHEPRAEVNSLWCKRANATQWEVELMLDQSDGDFWVFRRDVRITRPRSLAMRRNPEGIPYLAPEIQLLYKARATRAEDQADFRQVVPYLTGDEKAWLQESLMQTAPEHAWISALQDQDVAPNGFADEVSS
jgi:hypothetical protein